MELKPLLMLRISRLGSQGSHPMLKDGVLAELISKALCTIVLSNWGFAHSLLGRRSVTPMVTPTCALRSSAGTRSNSPPHYPRAPETPTTAPCLLPPEASKDNRSTGEERRIEAENVWGSTWVRRELLKDPIRGV